MTNSIFILADGIPAPLIFFGFVALIMVLSGVLGGGKPKQTPRVPLGGAGGEAARQRAELQRRAEAQRQNLARRGVAPPPMPQQAVEARARQAKAARKAAAARAVAVAQQAPRPPTAVRPIPVAAPTAPVASRQPQSESARNLKLLLQRGGVREAVLLAEVLGTPKSLRDDA